MNLTLTIAAIVILFILAGVATVAAKLGLLGPETGEGDRPSEFQLEARPCIFSAAEAKFFGELTPVAAEMGLLVMPKVGLNDVFKDKNGAPKGQYNRYAQMHVDFLLVTRDSHRPVGGVELDGDSHQGKRQQGRDEKKAAVFKAAGLPLVRFHNYVAVGPGELRQKLEDTLGLAQTARLGA